MKIRNGFVSNSSSSSFIMHASVFKTAEEEKEFFDVLKKAVQEEAKTYSCSPKEVSWGDKGTFYKKGNMIVIELFAAPENVLGVVERFAKRSPNDVMDFY